MIFQLDEQFNTVAKMKVIGVGGAGGNAVNRMVDAGLSGVEFISVNTDAMALENNRAPHRVQIGEPPATIPTPPSSVRIPTSAGRRWRRIAIKLLPF